MSQTFDDPGASTGMSYGELEGSLLVIEVMSHEEHVPTVFTEPGQKSPAIRADVTVVDGPKAGAQYLDTLIFPKALVAQLSNRVGRTVLGRLGKGEAKPGQNAPWKLAAANDDDRRKAQVALAGAGASANTPPF